MSFANFFDKVAFGAAQVLQGFDRTAFEQMLASRVIGVAYDDTAINTHEGLSTLTLALNLLARLYPRMSLTPLGSEAKKKRPQLVRTIRAINPDIELGSDLGGAAVCLVVGVTEIEISGETIYVGSDGWVAKVSSVVPVGSGDSANPFGAGASACLGVANVFRLVFKEQLGEDVADTSVSMSLINYKLNEDKPQNPSLNSAAIGEVHLVGLGAIGNAAVWALSKVPDLTGVLQLVDNETVDLSNLQRYVLATQKTVGESKVEMASKALKKTQVKTHCHQKRWQNYVADKIDWQLEKVAVALDTAEDRLDVQASIPKWIINAWTQLGDLGVSRHSFLGNEACLMCLYLPDRIVPDLDDMVAAATGLELKEARALLHNGASVGMPVIEKIATAKSIPVDTIAQFADRPLRDFYVKAICGGIVLELQKENGVKLTPPIEVPMAFQSALAGIMLSAELVINAGGFRDDYDYVTTRIDLLRPLGSELSAREKKRPGCICQDEDYINAAHAKYSI